MEEQVRDFKGIWIPREIYLHPDLTWTEKMLYCEIDSLDGEDGCFASNEYFAKFFGVSERIISAGITKLKELGFIEQAGFDGRKRVLKAVLKKSSGQGRKKVLGRPDKNFHHNNIDYNTSLDNNKETKTINSFSRKVKTDFVPPTIDECKAYAKEMHCWKELGEDVYNFYSMNDWKDTRGKPVKNWKLKMYQWYMHDKEKYHDYSDMPCYQEQKDEDFVRAKPLRIVE